MITAVNTNFGTVAVRFTAGSEEIEPCKDLLNKVSTDLNLKYLLTGEIKKQGIIIEGYRVAITWRIV